MDEWGPVPRRNSINKHKAVHVLHEILFEPWTDTVDTSSEMLCSVRVERVDEGKTVTVKS